MRTGVLVLVAVCLAVQPTGLAVEFTRGGGNSLDDILSLFPAEDTLPIPLLEADVRPHALSIPAPKYSDMARQVGIEGLTVVEALVGVDGNVTEAKVFRSAGCLPLDQSAVQAAKGAKFQPAMQGDRPVPVRVGIPYRFVLTSGRPTTPASCDSAVTVVAMTPLAEARSYNDSVLQPLRGLHFVCLRRIAPWDSTRDRLVPDSAAIRFNNKVMRDVLAAFRGRQGGFFRKPSTYNLQVSSSYLLIDHGQTRIFYGGSTFRGWPSRASVYDVDSLRLKPDSLDGNYVEMPGWSELPQYIPMMFEIFIGTESRPLAAQAFGMSL
jgi:TonB family protein